MSLFKRKPKYIYVMVYKEIIDCDKFYMVHNFVNNERTVIKKKRSNHGRRTKETKNSNKKSKKTLYDLDKTY